MDDVADRPVALYNADILAWSQRQAAMLRQFGAGDRPADEVPDWANIAEEIEAVGRSELRACESLLTQAILHLLKTAAWPESTATEGWRAEALRFRFEASDAFSPSMRQHIDLDRLYARALRLMPVVIEGRPAGVVLERRLLTLDDLLATNV